MRRLLLFLGVFLLAACGADKEPTVLIYPSSTPRILNTLTPTDTLTPTATLDSSATATFTVPPPTVPPAESGAVPTSPLRPTFTEAPATQTATFAPTRSGMNIEYFISTQEQVSPGGHVTLYWRVNGADSARIYRLNVAGERSSFWDVLPEGRLTVGTDPDVTDGASFILVGQRENATIEEELIISTACPFRWFFAPAPEVCPGSEPIFDVMVEQQFENGFMIWVARDRQIYVIFADEAEPMWLQMNDEFTDGAPESDDTLQPPEGRLQPVRGFGLLWRNNAEIRDRLGWAVSSEASYDGIMQLLDSEEEALYLRRRDGVVLMLQANGEGWEPLSTTDALPLELTEEAPSLQPTEAQ